MILHIEKKIKYFFKNKNLLLEAISHKSIFNKNNERLEFIGDSILNFIISKNIYFINFNFSEGDMTKLRSHLVNSKMIIKIFNNMNIKKYIKLFNKNINISNSIIENIFESIIGAIFLDSNIYIVENFILRRYFKYFKLIYKYSLKILKDSKSILQEISQKFFFSLPKYKLYKIINLKKNKKIFYITCSVSYKNNYFSKIGLGHTKKSAEKLCAKKLISLMKYKKII